MKICLISAPTATDFEEAGDALHSEVRRFTDTPQLGILALAAVLDKAGITPRIVNLNRRYYDYLALDMTGVDAFASWAAEAILASPAEVYGFSTICSSYPLTIRIAAIVKRAQPDCAIVFGGPQASVVDLATLSAFPFVDCVLRGEAEETFPLLLEQLSGKRQYSCIPGLTYRSPFGPVRNANAPVIQDLDALPLPAFHLTGELATLASAPLELGRGCPFACKFCSTNDFFRRKFRLKSPERVLSDMRALSSRYGIRTFELAHDMFTVDRRRVVEFCECMLASGENFKWGCSARTDCVDEELLDLMARAGCQGIFFGVESGSPRMQKVFDKNLDVDQAREVVSLAEGYRIKTTVSLIVGFPEEHWDDVRDSVDFYMYALRHPCSSPQLNLLSPLAETPIHSKYRNELTLEELCSDMSHQGRMQNMADRALIAKYPDIFPNFYLLPVPYLDREYLVELREFLLSAPTQSRWLMVALHQSKGGILEAFSAWRKYRASVRPGVAGWSLRAFYMSGDARTEFVCFVRRHLGERGPAVECLLDYQEALSELRARPSSIPQPGPFLTRASGVHLFELDWDLVGVIESLKRGAPLVEVDRSVRSFRTGKGPGDEPFVFETSPLIAAGLQACDGKHTIEDFLQEIESKLNGPRDARRLAAECLLETLHSEGLIVTYNEQLHGVGASSET